MCIEKNREVVSHCSELPPDPCMPKRRTRRHAVAAPVKRALGLTTGAGVRSSCAKGSADGQGLCHAGGSKVRQGLRASQGAARSCRKLPRLRVGHAGHTPAAGEGLRAKPWLMMSSTSRSTHRLMLASAGRGAPRSRIHRGSWPCFLLGLVPPLTVAA